MGLGHIEPSPYKVLAIIFFKKLPLESIIFLYWHKFPFFPCWIKTGHQITCQEKTLPWTFGSCDNTIPTTKGIHFSRVGLTSLGHIMVYGSSQVSHSSKNRLISPWLDQVNSSKSTESNWVKRVQWLIPMSFNGVNWVWTPVSLPPRYSCKDRQLELLSKLLASLTW